MTAPSSTPTIDPVQLKQLSRVQTWRWLLAVLGDWLTILVAAALCLRFPAWWVWGIGVLVIGNRQHALAVLMHEAVHYRVSENRQLNDWLANVLAGYPVGLPTENYRVFHLAHHRWLDTPLDPEGEFVKAFPRDMTFPQSRRRFAFVLLRDLSGLWPRPLGVLMKLNWGLPGQRMHHLIPIGILHWTTAGILASYGMLLTYFLLWCVPMVTVFPTIFRIRGITEHSGIAGNARRYTREHPETLRTTRSIRSCFGAWLFGPHQIHYHLEHHLYPSVPFYNLRRLSRLLETAYPDDFGTRVRASYGQALGECLK